MESVQIDFDLSSGLSRTRDSLKRYLSAMEGIFSDDAAYASQLEKQDILVYEFYDMGVPASEKAVAYGTSITYPGKIGDEYFMTKGHFHTVIDTAEVYYCLRGQGIMLMENPEGAWETRELTPGIAVYVPPRYAHRSVNIAAHDPLVTFFAFPGHAGHDYGTIETKGFRKLIKEHNGAPVVVDNPNWGH